MSEVVAREIFEKWAVAHYLDIGRKEGYYIERTTSESWDAWRASAKQSQGIISELVRTFEQYMECTERWFGSRCETGHHYEITEARVAINKAKKVLI